MKKVIQLHLDKILLIILLAIALFIASCEKAESYPPQYSKAKVTAELTISNSAAVWNSITNVNSLGNQFSVNTFKCYLSNITLTRNDGKKYKNENVFYLDLSNVDKSSFKLDSIPPGKYTGISFLVGLDTKRNKTLALPGTRENINMAWPDMMGGGYHFLKFEGQYLDNFNIEQGFAFHLGTNSQLPFVTMETLMNQSLWNHEYTLNIDLDKIFNGDYSYNLQSEVNYTMSDSIAMSKIKSNMKYAFSLKQLK